MKRSRGVRRLRISIGASCPDPSSTRNSFPEFLNRIFCPPQERSGTVRCAWLCLYRVCTTLRGRTSFGDASIHYTEHCDDAPVIVVKAVEDQEPSEANQIRCCDGDPRLGPGRMRVCSSDFAGAGTQSMMPRTADQNRSPSCCSYWLQAALDDGWNTLPCLGRALQSIAAVDTYLSCASHRSTLKHWRVCSLSHRQHPRSPCRPVPRETLARPSSVGF